MMFSPDDSWQAFLDECWRRATPATGYTEESQCRAIGRARAFPAKTLAEGLREAAASRFDGPAIWIAWHMLPTLPDELRATFIDEATKERPSLARNLHLRQASNG